MHIRLSIPRLVWIFTACLAMLRSAEAVPIVFNATESASPGDVIYLQGDKFTTTPEVCFHRVLTSDTSLAPDVDLTIISSSTQAVTAALPSNIPLGLYAVWVRDSAGHLSNPCFINRARADSFEYLQIAPYSASDSASSYTFRIFGRNLYLKGSTPTVTFVDGTSAYSATVVTTYANDSTELQVRAPAEISPGTTYAVEVSNGSGHSSANYDVTEASRTIEGRNGGADPFNLGVPWASDFTNIAADAINAVSHTNPHTGLPYGADPSGTHNSVDAIQQALYDAANTAYHPNGATVYLPAGTYLVDAGTESTTFHGPTGTTLSQPAGLELDIPGHVVLQGAGIGQTVINDNSPAVNGSAFITFAHAPPNNGTYSGIQGFTYNQIRTASANAWPPSIRNFASNSSEMFIDHIQADFAHGIFNTSNVVYGQFIPLGNNDNEVLVQNCTMSHLRYGNPNYYSYGYTYGSAYIFRNNVFSSWLARLEFDYTDDQLIEGNHFTRDGSFPPPGYGGNPTCGGIQATGADHKILRNKFDAINLPLPQSNDGESILCQSGPTFGGQTRLLDSGTVTSASANRLNDTTKAWTGSNFNGQIILITSGPGQGQWAEILGNTATSLGLDRAWTTTPTSSSTYAIEVGNSYARGTPTGTTSTTVTDATQNWIPNFEVGESIAIIQGTGMGQIRKIIGNTATTVTVSPAWDENPDTGSHYAIDGTLNYDAQRWLVKGNTLQDMIRGIILYNGGYDCAVVHNSLFSSGGIFLTGWQRDSQNGNPWNRVDLAWKNLIADNVVCDPENARTAYFAVHGGLVGNSPLYGVMVVGTESRNNLLWASTPNSSDASFHCDESFANIVTQQTIGNSNIGIGVLDSIYNGNTMVDCDNAFETGTAVSQTPLWKNLLLNCDNDLKDPMPTDTVPSNQTVLDDTGESRIFEANFSGTGTSTGTGDTGENLIDIGAGAQLVQTAGQTAGILSTAPFNSGSGSYMRIAWLGNSGGAGAGIQSAAIAPHLSWARIFDQRSGQWLVNGGFDFFLRPGQTYPTAVAPYLRPIDMGYGTDIRMVLTYCGNKQIDLQIITPTGGGGVNDIKGAYSAGFVAGSIYHLGFTFSTDVTQTPPRTTVKIFMAPGTGSIDTTSTARQIATGTFALDHTVVNDTTPTTWYNGGPWNFGGGYGPPGIPVTNEFDGLRLYYKAPDAFPALGD